MSSEWEVVRLVDVASIRNGAGVKQEFFANHGIPLARVTNFTDSSINLMGSVKVNPEHANRWKAHRLNAGDALVATVGSWPPNWASVVGKAVLVPSSAEGAIQNQNTCCIKALSGKANQRFIYYTLKSEGFAHYAANSASGSANQARLPVSKLEEFTFNLPPLEEQESIAGMLGCLDDRITLLRETNATLEAIAQALFKSWFVDFDPVRAKMEGRAPEGMDEATAALFPDSFEETELGAVPRGWRNGKVSELGTVVCGKTPPTSCSENYGDDIPFITIPDMHGLLAVTKTARSLSRQGADSQVKKYLPVGSVCVSCIATPGLVTQVTRPSQTNQQINSVIPLDQWGKAFPLFLLRRIGHAVRMGGAGGSVFHNLSKSGFEAIKVFLPPCALAQVFNAYAEPLVERVVENQKQVEVLSSLRDTLLPRLISGVLQTPEVGVLVG